MRLNRTEESFGLPAPMAGSLLLAHPTMIDPNFRRAVVLLTAHSLKEGTLGVIINRPMNKTLGEFDPELADSDMSDIPLYHGGPVAADQMILVAWKWSDPDGTFKLFFGIDEEKARALMNSDEGFELRGFIGHSGWTGGQLEAELQEGAWVVSPLAHEMSGPEHGKIWKDVLSRVSPEMRLLAEEPDDPSVN